MAVRADEELSVAAVFARALRNLVALSEDGARRAVPTPQQVLSAAADGDRDDGVSPVLFRVVQLCALPEVLGDSAGPVLYLAGKRFASSLQLGSLQVMKEWFARVGLGELEVELDDEKLVVKLVGCATSHHLPSVGAAICDFERGLIDGVLEGITGTDVLTKETLCWGLGDTVCQFEAYAGDGSGYVYREHGGRSQVQERLLAGVADQAELAVENLRLVRERKEIETRDPLTGLYNFRHLREHAALEIARAARYGRHVTFVMVDLDDFAQVVQAGGQDAGDAVIALWAEDFRSRLRACDLVCRYGADEFLLVLPETAESEADSALQRVLGVLADRECTVDGTGYRLSASAGVAVYPQDGQRVEELVAKAATTLYALKASGGGRVGFYGASTA